MYVCIHVCIHVCTLHPYEVTLKSEGSYYTEEDSQSQKVLIIKAASGGL